MDVMQGFPPPPEARATLANWRTAPYCKWAFHHVREIVPSAPIAHDPGRVWALPERPVELPIDALIGSVSNDALVVLKDGMLVHESYRNGMGPRDPHILMSVSKSVLGLLAGILEAEGLLDISASLTRYLPELETTAYAGATVRQALDMRVGVAFDEDYTASAGPIIDYRKAANWNPVPEGEEALDLRGFQSLLTEADGSHGGPFHYVSPVTDLLAWVFERAAGARYADLLSRFLWQPLGAEADAYITVDRIGGPRAAGGLCVTPRDLARLGQVMLQGGRRDDVQVIPEPWLKDIFAGGDRDAWVQGDFADKFDSLDMSYRSKWYVHHGPEPLIHGLGIHGQFLFLDPKRQVVVAWLSSEHDPTNEDWSAHVFDAVEKIRTLLS